MKDVRFLLAGAALLLTTSCHHDGDTAVPFLWQQQPTPQPLADVQALPFASSQAGWVMGGYYAAPTSNSWQHFLLRTTDGGTTWTSINLAPSHTVRGLRSLAPVTAQLLYGTADDLALSLVQGAQSRFVYQSQDGGQSWQRLPSTGYSDGTVTFPTAQVGLSPYSARIVRTADGGATWQPVWTGTQGTDWVNQVVFPTATIGFAAGGCLLKTTDQGQTWQPLPWANGMIRRLYFLNASLGFALTESGTIPIIGPGNIATALYRTQNGGQTWEQLLSSASGPYAFISATEFYRASTRIEHTRDSGQSWQTEYELPAGTDPVPDTFADITFPDAGNGYAVSRAGVVVKRQ